MVQPVCKIYIGAKSVPCCSLTRSADVYDVAVWKYLYLYILSIANGECVCHRTYLNDVIINVYYDCICIKPVVYVNTKPPALQRRK